MIRAIAWDIDGTLIDSEPLHHEALVHASLQFGVDLRDLPSEAYQGVHIGDVWIALRDRLPQDPRSYGSFRSSGCCKSASRTRGASPSMPISPR